MFRSIFLLPAFIASAYALVHAVDPSTLVSVATWSKAKGEGFTKAIIRGYYEACGSGGAVDPTLFPLTTMPELRGTPTSIRTGSHAMGRGISANRMRNGSPKYLRPLMPTI